MRYLILSIVILLMFSCKDKGGDITKMPIKVLKNYSLHFDKSPEKRIFRVPDFLMKKWMKWDKRTDYKVFMPEKKDLHRIAAVIKKLPPLHYKVLKKKLIAIYFVENILGSGIADWVIGPNNEFYYYIILNPNNLKNTMSEQLTWRTSTAFIKNSGKEKVYIDCGAKLSGLDYILLHEVTHIVDYEKRITPFVESKIKNIQPGKNKDHKFTTSVWKDYKVSKELFPYQKGIKFYGLSGKPELKSSDSVKIYRSLEKTSYVSLYGTTTWAEDLADFLTFYHITQRMKIPYVIKIKKGNKRIYSYEPMKNSLVKKRFKHMKIFYE